MATLRIIYMWQTITKVHLTVGWPCVQVGGDGPDPCVDVHMWCPDQMV